MSHRSSRAHPVGRPLSTTRFLPAVTRRWRRLDDSSGAFDMFVEDLFCGWVKARQVAGARPEETASRLLGRMDDDPYGFCYGLETKVASVLDKAGLAALVAQVRERLAAPDGPDRAHTVPHLGTSNGPSGATRR